MAETLAPELLFHVGSGSQFVGIGIGHGSYKFCGRLAVIQRPLYLAALFSGVWLRPASHCILCILLTPQDFSARLEHFFRFSQSYSKENTLKI